MIKHIFWVKEHRRTLSRLALGAVTILGIGSCGGSDLVSEGPIEAAVEPASAIQSVPAKRADEFVNSIGTNIHLGYFGTPYATGWSSIVKPKILALGIRHVRDIGVVVNDDTWMNIVYGRMKELSDRGIKFNLVMRPAEGVTNYTHVNHFTRLMQYAAPVVESFEGLNEHDLSKRAAWATEARTFQQALYAKLKSDSRTATLPVFGPSMGKPANAALVGSLSAYMNYGAIHPYPGGKEPSAALSYHQTNVLPLSGSKKLVATESGYHTAMSWTSDHPPVSEAAMARYVPRLFLEYFQAGIPRSWLYEFIDQGTDQTHREQHFGLLRANGSEKPVYVALKNVITVFKDPGSSFPPGPLSYGLAGQTTNVRQLLLQKRDGKFYLVLWQGVSSYNLTTKLDVPVAPKPVTVQLSAAARQVRLFTPLTSQNSVWQAVNVSSFPVSVPDHPVVVEITR